MHPNAFVTARGIPVVFFFLLVLIAGSLSQSAEPAAQENVSVICTAGLQPSVTAIVNQFKTKYPRYAVTLVSDEVGSLQQRVSAGQLDGVLITIGPKELVPFDKHDCLLPGSGILLADVPLALIVRGGRTIPGNLSELDRPEIHKVALAKVSSSMNEGAIEALAAAGVWDAVQPKVMLYNPGEVVGQVAGGQADAGIIGMQLVNKLVHVNQLIDTRRYLPIQIVAVQTSHVNLNAATKAFLAYLQTDKARAPLYQLGLTRPKADRATAHRLLLSCDATLRRPVDELIAAFHKKTGITVVPIYTDADSLLALFTIGQTGDLFLPATMAGIERATQRGFMQEYPVILLTPAKAATTGQAPLGLLKFNKNPRDAKIFFEFASGPEGEAIFAKYNLDAQP